MMMTNRERVIAAINFQKTDFVPYDVGFTQQAHDSVVRAYGESWFKSFDSHITSVDLAKPQIEVKPAYFRDEYGVVWNKSGADKDTGMPAEYLITDFESFEKYDFPLVDESFIRRTCEDLIQIKNDNFKGVMLVFSLFERLWTLMGMEDSMANMLLEPELIHSILERICKRNLDILDVALDYDFDFVYFGDDWGQQQGLIMGVTHWREFVKPYLKQMYSQVKRAGKYIIQHSCGDNREIMEDLYELGLNVYQTFQPEIYGLDYSKKLRGKVAIFGGISTQRDLPAKTPDEIKIITKNTIAHFKEHGGLIIAPTHAIPGDVPAENIAAMIEVFTNQ